MAGKGASRTVGDAKMGRGIDRSVHDWARVMSWLEKQDAPPPLCEVEKWLQLHGKKPSVASVTAKNALKALGAKGLGDSGVAGLTGLLNSGNSCYMNAALQCLARINPLRSAIVRASALPG